MACLDLYRLTEVNLFFCVTQWKLSTGSNTDVRHIFHFIYASIPIFSVIFGFTCTTRGFMDIYNVEVKHIKVLTFEFIFLIFSFLYLCRYLIKMLVDCFGVKFFHTERITHLPNYHTSDPRRLVDFSSLTPTSCLRNGPQSFLIIKIYY